MSEQGVSYPFIAALRVAAVFLVVLYSAADYVGMAEWGPYHLIVHPLHAVAVPLLFAAEGFLALAAPRGYLSGLGRGMRDLLLPWLLLGLLYVALRAMLELNGYLAGTYYADLSLQGLSQVIYASEIAPHLVILPALFLLRVAAGPIRQLLRAPGYLTVLFYLLSVALFAFGVDALAARAPAGESDPFVYALWGMPFFAAGALLARFERWFRRNWLPLALALGGLYVAGQVPGWMLFPGMGYQHVQLFATLVLFLGLFDRRAGLARLGGAALPVYILHAPVVIKAMLITVSPWLASKLALWAAVGTLTFFFTLFTATALATLPGLRWLFGGAGMGTALPQRPAETAQ